MHGLIFTKHTRPSVDLPSVVAGDSGIVETSLHCNSTSLLPLLLLPLLAPETSSCKSLIVMLYHSIGVLTKKTSYL